MITAENFTILQRHVYQHNKKKSDRTLQTRDTKKISLFFRHISYDWKFSMSQTDTEEILESSINYLSPGPMVVVHIRFIIP